MDSLGRPSVHPSALARCCPIGGRARRLPSTKRLRSLPRPVAPPKRARPTARRSTLVKTGRHDENAGGSGTAPRAPRKIAERGRATPLGARDANAVLSKGDVTIKLARNDGSTRRSTRHSHRKHQERPDWSRDPRRAQDRDVNDAFPQHERTHGLAPSSPSQGALATAITSWLRPLGHIGRLVGHGPPSRCGQPEESGDGRPQRQRQHRTLERFSLAALKRKTPLALGGLTPRKRAARDTGDVATVGRARITLLSPGSSTTGSAASSGDIATVGCARIALLSPDSSTTSSPISSTASLSAASPAVHSANSSVGASRLALAVRGLGLASAARTLKAKQAAWHRMAEMQHSVSLRRQRQEQEVAQQESLAAQRALEEAEERQGQQEREQAEAAHRQRQALEHAASSSHRVSPKRKADSNPLSSSESRPSKSPRLLAPSSPAADESSWADVSGSIAAIETRRQTRALPRRSLHQLRPRAQSVPTSTASPDCSSAPSFAAVGSNDWGLPLLPSAAAFADASASLEASTSTAPSATAPAEVHIVVSSPGSLSHIASPACPCCPQCSGQLSCSTCDALLAAPQHVVSDRPPAQLVEPLEADHSSDSNVVRAVWSPTAAARRTRACSSAWFFCDVDGDVIMKDITDCTC